MNQYEQYRDSGVDWIGAVPSHWSVERTKYRFQIAKRQVPHAGQEILSITQSGIRPKNIAENEGQMAQNYDGYQEVHVGDFAMNSMDLLTGWVDLSQYEGLTSPDYRVFAPVDADAINPTYFKYVFQLLYMRKIYYKFGQGVSNLGRWRLQKPAFMNFPLPVPPSIEQSAIAKHLDSVTAEIHDLKLKLAEQRALLERYKRQVVVETAKHGLDGEAPTRDSGIPWLGSIPSHWEIRTLSFLTDENKVKNTDLREKNLLSLSYGRLIRKDIEDAFGLLPASFDGYQIVEDGYIILRMTDLQNDHRSLRTALATERGIITNAYIGLIPRPGVSSRYLAWMLRAIDLQKIFYGLGSGVRQSLNYNELRKLPALLPPLDEQEAIADFIDGKSDEINALIADIDRQVELLDTYRKQLISDVVTGKIRVSEDAS